MRGFTFAYLAYKGKKSHPNKFEVNEKDIMSVYESYQTFLNVELFRRKGMAKFEEIKIFDFDNYDDNMEVTFDPAGFK